MPLTCIFKIIKIIIIIIIKIITIIIQLKIMKKEKIIKNQAHNIIVNSKGFKILYIKIFLRIR
jgi:hypothetical protein